MLRIRMSREPFSSFGSQGHSVVKDSNMNIYSRVTPLWNQPRCLPTNEWIKKLQYTYTMAFYSAIHEIMTFAVKWIEMKNMLSEISQT